MFDYNALIASVVTFILGGGLVKFITWRSEKKKMAAEAAQAEADARRADGNADTVELANAKELIAMYRDGIKDLTELHEKQQRESQLKYDALEKRVAAEQKVLVEKINRLEKSSRETKEYYEGKIREMQSKYDDLLSIFKGSCADCEFFNECQKRKKYGVTK